VDNAGQSFACHSFLMWSYKIAKIVSFFSCWAKLWGRNNWTLRKIYLNYLKNGINQSVLPQKQMYVTCNNYYKFSKEKKLSNQNLAINIWLVHSD
jgi:hypothetical protein